jgi:DNA-binding NarL/FixJ family response regulator
VAPIRIVLVDDAQEMRELIGLSLRIGGTFDVVGEAANGAEGVELAAATRPDLVLLDLSMPVMDGLEALPLILERSPDTVVVVFSGFDEHQLGAKARDRGAAAYVEKGVPLDVLAATLAEVYEEQAARRP